MSESTIKAEEGDGMGAKIRRLENNLMTLGTGVIAFGAWQLAKTMLSVFPTAAMHPTLASLSTSRLSLAS